MACRVSSMVALAGLSGALAGCAPWLDDEDVWFDAPEQLDAPSPGVEFGYGDVDVRSETSSPPQVEPIAAGPVGHGGSASFAGRRTGPVCTLRMPKAYVRGHIDREDIRRTVQRHENDVRVCYNRSLRRVPDLTGRVTLTFVIAPDGSVSHAEAVGDTLRDDALDRCLARAAKRWTFPVPPDTDPAIVHYPYVFSAS